MLIPDEIKNFILNRKSKDLPSDICTSCNSTCCKGPGFGIFENIVEIYSKYLSGQLQRNDYLFELNLSLSDFIYKYFDRTVFNGSLLVFFPKVLSENNNLISIPPWNYYQSRDYILKRINNYGCIFLKNKWNTEGSENYCILHSDDIYKTINHKPIDCVFLTCNHPQTVKTPLVRESNMWLALLDFHFPDSRDKFSQLFPNLPD